MKKRHKIEIPAEESSSQEVLESSSSSRTSPEDDCCLPDDCPDLIETPRFPSPTSCLPEGRLHELEEKIDGANRMLLDLALSNEQSELGRRNLFDGLAGEMVKIKISCSDSDDNLLGESPEFIEEVINKKSKTKKRPKKKRLAKKNKLKRKQRLKKKKLSKKFLEGFVQLVGNDFVQIQKNGKMYLIPFRRTCLVLSKKPYQPPKSQTPLADIDPCFRRELTYNFGETVAGDPELVQIFFRIKLAMYLMTFEDQKFTVYTNAGKETGLLKRCENGKIHLVTQSDQEIEIPFSSCCYLKKM